MNAPVRDAAIRLSADVGGTFTDLFLLDAQTGKELWVTKLEYTATANPMTYLGANGKQYVAVASQSAIFVFGL